MSQSETYKDWVKHKVQGIPHRCGVCNRQIDSNGNSLIEACYYCAHQCDECGGGDCDGSC